MTSGSSVAWLMKSMLWRAITFFKRLPLIKSTVTTPEVCTHLTVNTITESHSFEFFERRFLRCEQLRTLFLALVPRCTHLLGWTVASSLPLALCLIAVRTKQVSAETHNWFIAWHLKSTLSHWRGLHILSTLLSSKRWVPHRKDCQHNWMSYFLNFLLNIWS